MTKVSVIIPVYNTEAYLRCCLDSVMAQTMKEIEIICVNDGSSDGSPEILDEYALNDARIRVIHKENGGVVSARKAGEAIARGQYIGYVDSDDWIDTQMYERLYTCAMESGAELVSSGYYLEGNYTSELLDSVDGGLYEGEGIQKLRENTIYCMKKKETGLRGSFCCKLFSRELLERNPFPIPEDIIIAEDKMQIIACVMECRSAFVLKESWYHYRINPGSAIHSGNPSYLLCVDKVYQYLRKLYNHPNFTETIRQQAELYIVDMMLAGINTRLGFQMRNLLWFDPYWLERIPPDSKVVLYGGGEAGGKYQTQLLAKAKHRFVGCIDFEFGRIKDDSLQIQPPQALSFMDYDYVVITIKNPGKALQVRKQLERIGVEESRILWFEQKELFWKYAEAEGLLNGGNDTDETEKA